MRFPAARLSRTLLLTLVLSSVAALPAAPFAVRAKAGSPPATLAASQFQFTQTTFVVQEDVTFVTLTVQRTSGIEEHATVDYATADGTATERKDYTTAAGTLRFVPGEAAKIPPCEGESPNCP